MKPKHTIKKVGFCALWGITKKLTAVASQVESVVGKKIGQMRLPESTRPLVLAGVFVALASQINQAQAFDNAVMLIDEKKAPRIVADIAPYTPIIQEEISVVKQHLASQDQQMFMENSSVQETTNSPFHYTVQKGDTISNIASRFELNVATILEANSLSAKDTQRLKAGTDLIIPPYKTSNSIAWLEEINKIKEEEALKRAKELAKRRARLARANRTVAYRESSSARESGGSGSYGFIVPINHKGISRGVSRRHAGIDYRANIGTPVVAARSGVVKLTTRGFGRGFGISVLLSHSGNLTTRYAHLSKLAVSPGESVKQGQIIGYSGNTGWSTGPHLHFEVRKNGRVVRPF